jgi:arylsulfatase A-like enzyme
MRAGWLAGLALVVVAAAAAVAWRLAAAPALPDTVRVDEVVADLAPALGGDRPRTTLRPLPPMHHDGGAREAIPTPPGTRLATRLAVPDDAALVLGLTVAGATRRDSSRTGVRFTVSVDGRPVATRTLNPAATRDDRGWLALRVPLPPSPTPVELVVETAAEDPDAPLAGEAGVADARLVRTRTAPRQTASPTQPSVLVLLVDTLRADAFQPGSGRTPVLDALAARGLRFTEAVAQASWTLPSVASILTGLHPRSHGVVGREDGAAPARALSDAFVTLPELAAAAGIGTFAVSANPVVTRGTNLAQGFETFVELGWVGGRQGWEAAPALDAALLEWLRQQRGRRFFAWVQYMEPHDPYTPPAPPPAPPGVRPVVAEGRIDVLGRRVNRGEAPPLAADELSHLRALYDAEVAAFDRGLGRLLADLDALGLLDTTVIVVTADHGEAFQEHGHLKHAVSLYDELVRVPLVIAGPGIAPGRNLVPVQGIDLYPTIARLLGLTPPAGLPGRDLLAPIPEAPIVSETSLGAGPNGTPTELVAVRHEGWKLVHAPQLERVELYDLAADPAERVDRAASAPEQAQRLMAQLDAWRRTVPPPPAAAGAADLGDRLRALGYVE